MTQDLWSTVESYIVDALVGRDADLEHALQTSAEAALPRIAVSPTEGKLLHLLARSCGARRILEIGTLGGYSTIWLARALPADGRMITLEINPAHAAVATANLARAGVASQVDVRVGAALQSLAKLVAAGEPAFDFIFIDADKPNNAAYFSRALQLAHVGSVIVVDNVVRNGAVADSTSTDPDVRGVRELNARLASEPRVSATAIQTVGSKGYDGFAYAVVIR